MDIVRLFPREIIRIGPTHGEEFTEDIFPGGIHGIALPRDQNLTAEVEVYVYEVVKLGTFKSIPDIFESLGNGHPPLRTAAQVIRFYGDHRDKISDGNFFQVGSFIVEILRFEELGFAVNTLPLSHNPTWSPGVRLICLADASPSRN